MEKIRRSFKRHFFSGLLIVVPIAITFIVVSAILNGLDNLLRPYIEPRLGFWPVGLGAFATLLLIWFTGILTNNILFKRMLITAENFVYKLPVIKIVYSAVKQILETFSQNEKQSFKQVVLVEYPSEGLWSVGFVNGETVLPGETEKKLNILIFTSINPTSGYFILAPESKTVPLDISIEEGLKWAVSGGIVKPRNF